MRRYIPYVLVALSVVVIAVGVVLMTQQNTPAAVSPTPGSTSEAPRITVQELQQQLQGGNPPQVWDVRGTEAYSAGHLPGSKQVDLVNVEAAAAGIDRNQPIITLCS